MPQKGTDAVHLRSRVVEILKTRGYEHRDEAFQLSSGGWSHDYVDCRRALSRGDALEVASRAVAASLADLGIGYDRVGGLTMGADPLAHGVAMVDGTAWFSVRKATKEHGTKKLIEGADLGAANSVVLVEDVVTSGSSIHQAYEAVVAAGATIAVAMPLLDRGDRARKLFGDLGVRYEPIATYEDLGIAPI